MAKVAMVVSNGHHPDPRVHKEAIALVEAGFDVTIHAFDRENNLSAQEDMDGYRVVRYNVSRPVSSGSANMIFHNKKFRKMVGSRLLETKPEIIHCHDADTLALGVRMKKEYGAKLVFDMHDLAHTWAIMPNPMNPFRHFVGKLLKQKMLRLIRFSDAVFTSSGKLEGGEFDGLAEWLEKRGVKSTTVFNRPLKTNIAEQHTGDYTLGFIGRVRDQASFDLLAKAIELLEPDERPIVRIAGDGIIHNYINNRFAKLCSSGLKLRMTGRFQLQELHEIISETSVMYCVYDPRRGNIPEGALPVKMFDAAFHNRPIICNSECLMEDLLGTEGFCGVAIPWGDAEKLADAIRSLANFDGDYEKTLTWEDEAKKIVKGYRQLLIK